MLKRRISQLLQEMDTLFLCVSISLHPHQQAVVLWLLPTMEEASQCVIWSLNRTTAGTMPRSWDAPVSMWIIALLLSIRSLPQLKTVSTLLNGYESENASRSCARLIFHQAAANANKLGADPSKGFVVSGPSAGGNLAAVVSHLARDEKLSPPITGVSLMIPLLTDYTLKEFPEEYKHEIVSYEQNGTAPFLGLASLKMFLGKTAFF